MAASCWPWARGASAGWSWRPEHLDPGVVLNSWVSWYLARDLLPDRRVVVRFDFPDRPRKADQLWIIFDGERSEICRTNPGYERTWW